MAETLTTLWGFPLTSACTILFSRLLTGLAPEEDGISLDKLKEAAGERVEKFLPNLFIPNVYDIPSYAFLRSEESEWYWCIRREDLRNNWPIGVLPAT